MKRTTDWQWAHITCALYIPECFFYDCDAREPIDVTRVPHSRKDLKCYVCGKEDGATVECKIQSRAEQSSVCAHRSIDIIEAVAVLVLPPRCARC